MRSNYLVSRYGTLILGLISLFWSIIIYVEAKFVSQAEYKATMEAVTHRLQRIENKLDTALR